MKTIIFFILSAALSQNLFAYETTITTLSERTYAPVDMKYAGFYGAWDEYYHYQKGDQDLATITIHFNRGEIGRDVDALQRLGMKESAKIGANAAYFVSSAVYKDTGEVAFATFHCVRTKVFSDILLLEEKQAKLDAQKKASEAFWIEMRRTQFGDKLADVEEMFGRNDGRDLLGAVGLTKKEFSSTTGMPLTAYFDSKTGVKVSEATADKRRIDFMASQIKSVYLNNAELYVADYNKIQEIRSRYPNIPETMSQLPNIDNFRKLVAKSL